MAALTLGAALFALAPEAPAQFMARGRTQTFVGAGGPVALTPGVGYYGATVAAPTPVVGSVSSGYSYSSGYAAPAYPYSYFAVNQPFTNARGYVGLPGTTDFPFHGQAYGHPYDPWTWPYLASYGHGPGWGYGLQRYYYPILK